ncbi:DUF3576 domain-containing protein [uncultured Algimonas sp.]|uniref:DUF3576 domain-containing protein n=1 Tax=uncultured Algimonas sp. TaxID=1547920 RepID=UPI00262103BB|nr:DUF3576 domain-containing protein [uncultured Algimonas sp.]
MAKRFISAQLPLCAAALIGLSACGTLGIGKSKSTDTRQAAAIAPTNGVNSFLWRATLETLNFMPLEQVDPFGGVVITDWRADPEAPDERLRATAYILDQNLRADALKISVFRQVRDGSGWADAPVDADTARELEDAVLTRARQLYIATVDNA